MCVKPTFYCNIYTDFMSTDLALSFLYTYTLFILCQIVVCYRNLLIKLTVLNITHVKLMCKLPLFYINTNYFRRLNKIKTPGKIPMEYGYKCIPDVINILPGILSHIKLYNFQFLPKGINRWIK